MAVTNKHQVGSDLNTVKTPGRSKLHYRKDTRIIVHTGTVRGVSESVLARISLDRAGSYVASCGPAWPPVANKCGNLGRHSADGFGSTSSNSRVADLFLFFSSLIGVGSQPQRQLGLARETTPLPSPPSDRFQFSTMEELGHGQAHHHPIPN
ncbi:hypothetical protein Sjap_003390 [Stephania japonica]|uniref:Uncharacterized protein n=1 Tax=Stephania japonica TaxID=461633 RepID=A0AAP0KRB0_9MAGN